MNAEDIHGFLERYAKNQHTVHEHELFISWLNTASQAEIQDVMDKYDELSAMYSPGTPYHLPGLEQLIEARLDAADAEDNRVSETAPRGIFKLNTRFISIAAMLLVVLTAGIIYLQKPSAIKNNKVIAEEKAGIIPVAVPGKPAYKNDVRPGANKATLTLADGTTIVLGEAKNGDIIKNGNMVIRKTADGQLAYNVLPQAPGEANALQINTISTPKGGQFQITLEDGTRVWLNAASSLKFPTGFGDTERVVELQGEAYFEVEKDKQRPFRVQSAGQLVEVLGTHFSINAYPNEPGVKTTLLEGSVRVVREASKQAVILTPGQQASVAGEVQVTDVDTTFAVAWKNGLISFKNAGIKSIMKQVERWYDVQVVYEADESKRTFSGDIPRNARLSELLQILETSNVHFKIEGKTITVMP